MRLVSPGRLQLPRVAQPDQPVQMKGMDHPLGVSKTPWASVGSLGWASDYLQVQRWVGLERPPLYRPSAAKACPLPQVGVSHRRPPHWQAVRLQ